MKSQTNRSTRSTRSLVARRVATVTALGVGLVGGVAGVASAAGHATTTTTTAHSASAHSTTPGPGNCAGGLVTAVTDSSITVEGLDGTTTTYALTSATTYAEGSTTISASDVVVGDQVMIGLSSTSSTTATRVDVREPTLTGWVSAVNGDVITITDLDGFTRTVVVDGSTTYEKSGAASALSDVTVGTVITAQGSVDANGTTLDATSVTIGQPTGGSGGPNGAGPGFAPPGAPGAAA